MDNRFFVTAIHNYSGVITVSMEAQRLNPYEKVLLTLSNHKVEELNLLKSIHTLISRLESIACQYGILNTYSFAHFNLSLDDRYENELWRPHHQDTAFTFHSNSLDICSVLVLEEKHLDTESIGMCHSCIQSIEDIYNVSLSFIPMLVSKAIYQSWEPIPSP